MGSGCSSKSTVLLHNAKHASASQQHLPPPTCKTLTKVLPGPTVSPEDKPDLSVCCGSFKLDGMAISDAAAARIGTSLVEQHADVICWLETDSFLGEDACWRRLVLVLESRGYHCFTSGGDVEETPAVRMANKDNAEPRYTVLLIAVRSEEICNWRAETKIMRTDVGQRSGAKGVLRRVLCHRSSYAVVVWGASFSSKEAEKQEQVKELCDHAKSLEEHVLEEMGHIQSSFGASCSWSNNETKSHGILGTGAPPMRFTSVCMGDFNERPKVPDDWQYKDADGCNQLTDDALATIVARLSGVEGRRSLLTLAPSHHGTELQSMFYDNTQWWSDGQGDGVAMPTYQRTPYVQMFPELVPEALKKGRDGKPLIVTTAELQAQARTLGPQHAALVCQLNAMAAAEKAGFAGAEPDLIKQLYFGMRGKNAQTKSVVNEVQRYLNKDAHKRPCYLQMGWLDRIGYGQGFMTSFAHQQLSSFEVLYDVHGYDHLVTLGTVQCWLGPIPKL